MSIPRRAVPEQAPAGASRPWLPYVAPFAVFLLLTEAETLLPRPAGAVAPEAYLLVYAVKMVAVTAVAWWARSTWTDLRPRPSAAWTGAAVLAGLAVAALWVGLDGSFPRLPLLGNRTGFDPNRLPPAARTAFLALRLYGLVLLVPLVEELFWRSFLLRWLIQHRFQEVPIGRVTLPAALITSAFFGLAHPEWLPALLTGLLWAGLLWRSRSLGACWISHLTANLALGVYVLLTGSWRFW